MAVVVTREWSRDEYTRGESATISFVVSGAASRTAALQAVGNDEGIAEGSLYEEDATLSAEPLTAQKLGGMGAFRVIARFTPIENGTTGPPEDPAADVRISWGRATLTEPTDIDVGRRAIRNAAGDAYSPKPSRELRSRTFTITRWEPAYDYVKANTYEGRVNTNNWTVANSTVAFPPKTVKCLSITPASDYAPSDLLIPIAYTFEVRTTEATTSPYQFNVVNQGRRGWYSKSGTPTPGNITDGSGTPVNEDVLLNNNGTPIDTTLKVDGQAPVATPTPVTGYQVLTDTSGPAIVHIWQTTETADFTGIGL